MTEPAVDERSTTHPASDLGALQFAPRIVPKPWGGRRLAELGRQLPDDQDVGESWDIADLAPEATELPDPVSRVLHGPHAGRTLAELVDRDGPALLGSARATPSGRFPLLVKHLDARENLSVQVHPPAAALGQLPGACLKTETWVVVAADPGAELFLGVADGVTLADLQATVGTRAVVPLLRRVPATVGDVHHLPAGLLHALGAGVVVAEPQTPSDTTYRLYDWTEEYGRAPRAMHLAQAVTCLREAWEVNLRPPAVAGGDGLLVDTEHYRLTRSRAELERRVAVGPRPAARVVVVVTGELSGAELVGSLRPGGVVLLPAAWRGELRAASGTTWLDIDLVAPPLR